MSQVWMIRNSATDIHIFEKREHLLPSVKFSYHGCKDVHIVEKNENTPLPSVSFTVTGFRTKAQSEEGERFEEKIIAQCLPVWTEPCHI